MAGASHKKKIEKFKKAHPDGRKKFAAEKKSLRKVIRDVMDPEKRKTLDEKKRKDRLVRKTKKIEKENEVKLFSFD